MKILVLGGSGLVGSHILKRVNFFDMISTFNHNKLPNLEHSSYFISLPKDLGKLEELIRNEIPEIVINTIAYSNIDYCESNPKKTYDLHVNSMERICSICNKTESKIIHLSTDYVFDGKTGNYTEVDEPNPINVYGKTKLESEKIVLKNPSNVVFRTSHVYGWGEKIRFLNFVYQNLKNNNEIFAYDDISNSSTLIDDLVDSIFSAIKKSVRGVFHTTGSSCISRYKFAKIVAGEFGFNEKLVKPASIEKAEVVAKRPINVCLDNSKATKELGIKFSTIEEGISKVHEQMKVENIRD